MGSQNTSTMVKEYARKPSDEDTSCKAKGSDLRVHFKNTRETAMAIKNMSLEKAKKYLEDVMDKKRAIPFRRFCGGVGRTAQAAAAGSTNGQRRDEGPRHGQAVHHPHPGEPRRSAASPHLQGSRSHQSIHELPLPHRDHPLPARDQREEASQGPQDPAGKDRGLIA